MTDSIVVIIAVVVIFVILISQAWRRGQSNGELPSVENMRRLIREMQIEFDDSPLVDLTKKFDLVEQQFLFSMRVLQFVMPNGAIDWYTMLGVSPIKTREEMIDVINSFEQSTSHAAIIMRSDILQKCGLSRSEFIEGVQILCDFMKLSFKDDDELVRYKNYLFAEENRSYRGSKRYVEIIRREYIKKQD